MINIIDVQNLSFAYPGCPNIIRNLSFQLNSGEMRYIVGKSGAGKSTLLKIIRGYRLNFSGYVQVLGCDARYINSRLELKRKIAIIDQFDTILYDFDVIYNIMIPMIISGMNTIQARQKAMSLIDQLGIHKCINTQISHLSGGEKKRVIIARALAQHPSLLLADEPTADLDQDNANNIKKIVMNLSKSMNLSILWVTHHTDVFEDDKILIKV